MFEFILCSFTPDNPGIPRSSIKKAKRNPQSESVVHSSEENDSPGKARSSAPTLQFYYSGTKTVSGRVDVLAGYFEDESEIRLRE